MKIPKCPKTVTGKHDWSGAECNLQGEHKYFMGELLTHSKICTMYKRCNFCDLIDDRPKEEK